MRNLQHSEFENLRARAQYLGFLRSPHWISSGEDFDNFIVADDEGIEDSKLLIPIKHLKLGHLAEHFFMIWLQGQERYQKIAAHLQVMGQGTTLGEIDYLLYEKIQDRYLHVELAFKFYLFDPQVEGSYESKWIGPNRRDSLALKLDKLRDKQFPMLFRKETTDVMKSMKCDPKRFNQELCLKARFFVPENYDISLLEPNYRLLVAGKWIHYNAFTQEKYGSATFCIPDKNDWLIDPDQDVNFALFDWENFHAISSKLKTLTEGKRSPLCFMKTPTGCSRLFIVWW